VSRTSPGGDTRSRGAEIAYTAPRHVREAIASLRRTEDVRFSPDNRRLAIADFARNRVVLFDVEVTASASGASVALSHVIEIRSPDLKRPHGLDFVDDETLIVVNRGGDACLFALPKGEASDRVVELSPLHVMRAGGSHLLASPGSVCVHEGDRSLAEILICNNAGNTVTRHVLDRSAGYTPGDGRVLVQKWLDIPDGVSITRDRRWMAVSNHSHNNVLLYENPDALTPEADPHGVLRGLQCPHGVRFDADGRHIFVADAGAPYVHVYARKGGCWHGVHSPITSFQVMDTATFLRGKYNPQEGGPKGLDIDAGGNVLVVTSEFQTLTFLDLSAMLESTRAGSYRRIPAPTGLCTFATNSKSWIGPGGPEDGPAPGWWRYALRSRRP
jgi:DNA-binding beta-propeller fold protein YncE